MVRLNSPNNEYDRLWGKPVTDRKDFQLHVLVLDHVRTFYRMLWRSIHNCQSCTVLRKVAGLFKALDYDDIPRNENAFATAYFSKLKL
jgi:hypothetical protein